MIQLPTCAGLVLCQKFVVEENTRNLTLVNCFHRFPVDDLPWTAEPFCVYFCLTDGIGHGKVVIEIADSETLASVHESQFTFDSDDPTRPAPTVLRITGCNFETPGRYQVTVSVDQELIALAVFDVELLEE